MAPFIRSRRFLPEGGTQSCGRAIVIATVRCASSSAHSAIRGNAPRPAEVADGSIECWLHGSRFDLATGRVLSPPATRPVAVFAVRTDGGDVYVRLDDGGCEPAG